MLPTLRRKAPSLALVALLWPASAAAAVIPFALSGGSVALGTTEETGVSSVTGGVADLVTGSGPAFSLSFDTALDLGSAIILNPLETSLFAIGATLTSGVASSALSFPLSFTFTDLVLTLDSGELTAIGFPTRDFAVDPLAVALPTTTVDVDVLALLDGTASFSVLLDLTVPVPGYPPSGPPASLVIQGSLLFTQVPEPATGSLLGVALGALVALRARRGPQSAASPAP